MSKIVCKECYNEKYESWKKPFVEQPEEQNVLPEYNENVQHFKIYSVQDIADTLQNGEMMEILCVYCKMTHIGKDQNGVIKVRYINDTNWTNYNN